MNKRAIADAGLLVAYLDPDDQRHDWAVEEFERFAVFDTCEAVVAEAGHLITRAFGSPARVLGLLDIGVVQIAYDVRGDEARLEKLVTTYADRPMDFADACLVRMSEQHGNCEVLTADRDFHVYRRHGDQAIPVSIPESG
jgi:predicted nucleic acid-binding protein